MSNTVCHQPPLSSPHSTSPSRPTHPTCLSPSPSLSLSLCFDWFLFPCQHAIIPPHNSPKPPQPQPSLENKKKKNSSPTDHPKSSPADKPNLLSFFLCFVGGIFKFANFISKFAISGICWIFCTYWFVRSWHPFGWKENAMIIFIYFWVCYMYILWFVILGLYWFLCLWCWAMACRVGLSAEKKKKKKTHLLTKPDLGNWYGPTGRIWV